MSAHTRRVTRTVVNVPRTKPERIRVGIFYWLVMCKAYVILTHKDIKLLGLKLDEIYVDRSNKNKTL